MARALVRLFQRLLVLGLGVLSIWLIVYVFKLVDRRLPSVLALALSYAIAAYVILPRSVHLGVAILLRKRVPSYTVTGDGLPGDPVNVVLVGTLEQLRAAFAAAGWSEADRLSVKSSWRMIRAFVCNSPYPTAPFSTLFLFGRGQDIGFQKCINNSPRRRHHVRFWALNLAQQASLGKAQFWRKAAPPRPDTRVLWVGAGTKDTGFSLTRLTFQITHATDADTDIERDFIITELSSIRVIGEPISYRAGQRLPEHVNHYVTDGELSMASLVIEETER